MPTTLAVMGSLIARTHDSNAYCTYQLSSSIIVALSMAATNDDDDDDNNDDRNNPATMSQQQQKSENDKDDEIILRRLTSPVIDDPGLPLSDVLVAQVIAPSLQIAYLSVRHAPQPTWLQPLFETDVLYSRQGAFVAPALIHGAGSGHRVGWWVHWLLERTNAIVYRQSKDSDNDENEKIIILTLLTMKNTGIMAR